MGFLLVLVLVCLLCFGWFSFWFMVFGIYDLFWGFEFVVLFLVVSVGLVVFGVWCFWLLFCYCVYLFCCYDLFVCCCLWVLNVGFVFAVRLADSCVLSVSVLVLCLRWLQFCGFGLVFGWLLEFTLVSLRISLVWLLLSGFICILWVLIVWFGFVVWDFVWLF